MTSTREQLEKERTKKVAVIEKRDGLTEGLYRVKQGDGWRWFKVWVEFYPTTRWLKEEVTSLMDDTPIKGTRGKLEPELKARLESWL